MIQHVVILDYALVQLYLIINLSKNKKGEGTKAWVVCSRD